MIGLEMFIGNKTSKDLSKIEVYFQGDKSKTNIYRR